MPFSQKYTHLFTPTYLHPPIYAHLFTPTYLRPPIYPHLFTPTYLLPSVYMAVHAVMLSKKQRCARGGTNKCEGRHHLLLCKSYRHYYGFTYNVTLGNQLFLKTWELRLLIFHNCSDFKLYTHHNIPLHCPVRPELPKYFC